MISQSLLVDTFTPRTQTLTADGMGGWTESWADGTAFKGRLSSLSIEEKMASDKLTYFATHKIYCDVVSGIDEEMRLTGDFPYIFPVKLGPVTFQVVGVTKPSNLDTGHLEILVRLIN